MFQTEVNHFFQAFASDFMTEFMRLMTRLGYTTFLIFFLTFILFAIDFKKGFWLMQIMLITAVVTTFFKDLLAYPRPFHVDPTLKFLDTDLPDSATRYQEIKDANNFFEPLPDKIVSHFRNIKGISYGLPSGHTSIAAALWGSVGILFSHILVRYLVIFLILFVPLSRIYLGVHFLGDVLVGYLIGFVALFIFYQRVFHPQRTNQYFQTHTYSLDTWFALYLLIIPLLGLLLLPVEIWRIIAYWLGFNLGFLLINQSGLPSNEGTILQRSIRLILAIVIFIVLNKLAGDLESLLALKNYPIVSLILHIGVNFLFIWGSVELNVKLGLFKRMSKTIDNE